MASIGPVDMLVLAVAIGSAVVIGVRLRGTDQTLENFFVGNRALPWWAILGSIVATETSTATVLSLPGEGYGPNGFRFIQIALGFMLGRLVVVWLFLPRFFKGQVSSAYELLEAQFGTRVKSIASLLFLVTRNLGDGLRLFLAATVFQELTGWSFLVSAFGIGAVTMLYTYFGGMRSVVWNDCIQLIIYMIGALATVAILANLLPGGFSALIDYAESNGKLQWLEWYPPEVSDRVGDETDRSMWLYWLLEEPYQIWAGLIGGAFLSIGTHGTDQMMVQRYLCARNRMEASLALALSGVAVLLQFALFLTIGVGLAAFYASQENAIASGDQVFTHFIINHFPKNLGLVGLMLAAIFAAAMSTLSSSLNSSASAVINDFVLPRFGKSWNQRQLMKMTRPLILGFGCLQIAISIWATTFDQSVIRNSLAIAGFSAGLLLGWFGLAIFQPSLTSRDAIIGLLSGLAILLGLQFGSAAGDWLFGRPLQVAWPWFAPIGALATFGFAILANRIGHYFAIHRR